MKNVSAYIVLIGCFINWKLIAFVAKTLRQDKSEDVWVGGKRITIGQLSRFRPDHIITPSCLIIAAVILSQERTSGDHSSWIATPLALAALFLTAIMPFRLGVQGLLPISLMAFIVWGCHFVIFLYCTLYTHLIP